MEAIIPALGMSLAAAEAHGAGRCPASKIKGVPEALVHRFAPLTEWHTTGTHGNRTAFYDPHQVRAIFGLEIDIDMPPNPEAIAALALWQAEKQRLVTHVDCEVRWLEWGGPMHRPTCSERVVEGCTIGVKGQTATVLLPDGQTMKKRLGTRGFSFRAV